MLNIMSHKDDLHKHLSAGYYLPTACTIDGASFISFTEASKHFNIPQMTVTSRVKSKKWKTWNYNQSN